MTDEEFLCSIRQAPRDETLRLAYADWLEDRGDSRAKFLRIDAALVSRCLKPGFAPENDLDSVLEWEAASQMLARSWVDRAAIPCDLWLIGVSPRAKQLLLCKVHTVLTLHHRRTRDLLAKLPAKVKRRVSIGKLFRWIDNTGVRRIDGHRCCTMLRFGIRDSESGSSRCGD